MQDCINCLTKNGYELIDRSDECHAVFRKNIDGNKFLLLLIGPHESNNYQYILRGDFADTHDRWSNADYQRSFKNKDDFLKNWNRFWLFEDYSEEDEDDV